MKPGCPAVSEALLEEPPNKLPNNPREEEEEDVVTSVAVEAAKVLVLEATLLREVDEEVEIDDEEPPPKNSSNNFDNQPLDEEVDRLEDAAELVVAEAGELVELELPSKKFKSEERNPRLEVVAVAVDVATVAFVATAVASVVGTAVVTATPAAVVVVVAGERPKSWAHPTAWVVVKSTTLSRFSLRLFSFIGNAAATAATRKSLSCIGTLRS